MAVYKRGIFKFREKEVIVSPSEEFVSVDVTYPTSTVPYISAIFSRGDSSTVKIESNDWVIIQPSST